MKRLLPLLLACADRDRARCQGAGGYAACDVLDPEGRYLGRLEGPG